MTQSRYLGLRLPRDLLKAVETAAAAAGQSRSDWLRGALSAAIEHDAFVRRVEVLLRASEQRICTRVRDELERALHSIEIVDTALTSQRR